MKIWSLYINENGKKDLTIGFLAVVDHLVSICCRRRGYVYLCPFKIPFDAVTHKHHLYTLSKKSVLY